jgi:hypothetical protein
MLSRSLYDQMIETLVSIRKLIEALALISRTFADRGTQISSVHFQDHANIS